MTRPERVDVWLVAGGRYHDFDFARLELLKLLAEHPQLRVREESLYLRYEDTVVVTETGVENFTDFLPMELDEIENVVQEKGVVQKVPPIPASAIRRPGTDRQNR